MSSTTDTRDKILEYYMKVLRNLPQQFTSNKAADTFIKQNPLAFLFAVILDQGVTAERAWEMPYELNEILGHLDVYRIAGMTEVEIQGAFQKLPTKPRYWKTAANRIRRAAIQVVLRYQGEADSIWNDNPRAGDLQARFAAFDGIGQKKASMATRILGMDLSVPIRNWNEIDVSVDDMIARVFPRAGLSSSDDPRAIISAARQLSPSFPGALDLPCWVIGRNWCSPKSPKCSECYIGGVCPRVGV